MKGSCLCGQIEFSVLAPIPLLYQCHCSLCQKSTGAASNAAFLIPAEQFAWVKGEASISSYQKPSGYRVDFCSVCGSAVPNPYKRTKVWVPAGLLENSEGLVVGQHIFVGSKAHWEVIGGEAKQYESMP
jgi:hypothetical protein